MALATLGTSTCSPASQACFPQQERHPTTAGRAGSEEAAEAGGRARPASMQEPGAASSSRALLSFFQNQNAKQRFER
eukprot:COSAG01_NODE_3740_length_5746_cov_2.375421_2_plen_77_part_00